MKPKTKRCEASHPHRGGQADPAGKPDMLTSCRAGLHSLELCQILRACSKDLPENAILSSDSSDKFWLEIRDGARGQAASQGRTQEVEDGDWKGAEKVQDFCQSCYLSSAGQMVNTSSGPLFPGTREAEDQ